MKIRFILTIIAVIVNSQKGKDEGIIFPRKKEVSGLPLWQRMKESNLHTLSQSQVSYLWTNPLCMPFLNGTAKPFLLSQLLDNNCVVILFL